MSSAKGIRKFVARTLVALLPVALFVALYAWRDPFGVVHRFHGVSLEQGDSILRFPNNRFTAYEALRIVDPDHRYDAFIFGSSVSEAFSTKTWKTFLPDSTHTYHMSMASQYLQGIEGDLRYLLSHGWNVRHALIIIEAPMLDHRAQPDLIPKTPYYKASDDTDAFAWHTLFFNGFRDPEIFLYSLFPKKMETRLVNNQKLARVKQSGHDPLTNEWQFEAMDSLLLANPRAFYQKNFNQDLHPRYFQLPDRPRIKGGKARSLRRLAKLLREHNIDYRIIIPPLYQYPAMQPIDYAKLMEIFGAERVFNFSDDAALSTQYGAFYDGTHMSSVFCDSLIRRAYTPTF